MKERLQKLTDTLLRGDAYELLLRLTLLLLLLHGASSWMLEVPMRILCILGLAFPKLLTSRVLWGLIVASVLWVNATQWTWIDNHKYLISYWVIACALSIGVASRLENLAWNARVLLAAIFALATGYKIAMGEYHNGAFLHYTFLTDGRIEALVRMLTGVGESVFSENRLREAALRSIPAEGVRISLASASEIKMLSFALSYWTLLIEGTIALAFALGWKIRDLALQIFIVTTYVFLPVTGFAFILALLGFAQCHPERRMTRVLYLVIFVVVQTTVAPWGKIAVDLWPIK